MVKVYLNSVRDLGADPEGARAVVIGERETLVYEGDGHDAADYLRRCVSVGVSVCVRHAGGLHSCMNKPALWDDVREYV